MVGLNSKLNPLANAFVPLKFLTTDRTPVIDESTTLLASKLLDEAINAKKDAEVKQLTDSDLLNLAEKLISHRYQPYDSQCVKSYLATKLPRPIPTQPINLSDTSYDFSLFKTPKPLPLIGHFWGVYDHEAASRPTLSLSERPKALVDEVWSVKSQDLKLWNNSSCEEPCSCPPMFGYSLPIDFFSDRKTCSIKHVHLNRYEKVTNGSDSINVRSSNVDPDCSEPLTDYGKDDVDVQTVEYYSECLKEIISGVCGLISNTDENESDDDFSIDHSECKFLRSNLISSLCFDDKDDDLLEIEVTGENYSLDVKDKEEEDVYSILRNTPHPQTLDAAQELPSNSTCNPPCSDWCHSTPQHSTDAINLLKETLDFLSDTKDWMTAEHPQMSRLKPSLKRSFSSNDSDSFQVKTGNPATRKALQSMRRDPLNYFRAMRDKKDSWTDNDSGISCNWPSREDVGSDYSSDSKELEECDTPMWNLFSGEGTLWQPLANGPDTEQSKTLYKKGNELRRLRSAN